MLFKALAALASVLSLGSRQDPSLPTMTSPLPIAYPQGLARESPSYGHVQSGFHRSQDRNYPMGSNPIAPHPPVVIDAAEVLNNLNPDELTRIDTSRLKDFTEENRDPNEVEGVYTSQDRTLFIKDTYLSSMCNKNILQIAAEIFQKQAPPPNSDLIVPDQMLALDQLTDKVLVATDAIDGFRSFQFDNYKILESIYPDHGDISSMILSSYSLVPNLHNRDMGVCKEHGLCVADLDGLDFSLIKLESTYNYLFDLTQKTNIQTLNKDSIDLTSKVLNELKDTLSENVFSPVSKIDRDMLLKHKEAIIKHMESDPLNKKIEGKSLFHPEKSFNSLLKKLENKRVPELLLEGLKTRIDVTLNALERTKLYLEDNPQSDQKTLIIKFFQSIKKDRLAYSTKQHDIPAKTRKKLQASYKSALKQNPSLNILHLLPGEFDAFWSRADNCYALHTAIRFIGSSLHLKSSENSEL